MGEFASAQEYFDLALEIATRNNDQERAGRALNGTAVLYQEHGEIDLAEWFFLRARTAASLAQDSLTVGDVEQNLGIVANIRGDLRKALGHYRSALEHYEEIGHEHRIARALNNLGMLYIDLGEVDAAADALTRALSISVDVQDVVTESIIHLNRTELSLARGQPDQARESCDAAFEISSRIGDNRNTAEALKFYGAIYRETDKPHLAEVHLSQAVEIAARCKIPLTEAEAHRELSLVFRSQNRNREALHALNRAHVLFTELRAQREQAEVTKRVAQLEEDFLAVVQRWGESIEAKDRYTRGHCQRVAEYACRLAECLNFPAEDMVWFRMGAFLHDVGKTEVPESILNKPGRLTDEERSIMERHTVIGDEILAPIPFPWDIRPMVRSHHERWDGRGYPDRLAGEDIPLTARILHVADVFDALTSTRSYRQPLTANEALQLMEEDQGSFDPILFALFKALEEELRSSVECDLLVAN
jgi:putative nucleotidyltransferase with HDIG domain